MALVRCERKTCRSRNNRAVFLVDGRRLCLRCFEVSIETSGIEGHRITRLSDQEDDFHENTHCVTGRAVIA